MNEMYAKGEKEKQDEEVCGFASDPDLFSLRSGQMLSLRGREFCVF